ncbi:MAG TPA: hypothetical protein VMX94_01470 [Armatimonadota bacterium]|nr:hypothetical protein [Armatimonadota bacterium]
MNDIVVEVRGGVVVEVYTNITDARVVIVDWDEAEHPDQVGVAGGLLAHAQLEAMLGTTSAECRAVLGCSF